MGKLKWKRLEALGLWPRGSCRLTCRLEPADIGNRPAVPCMEHPVLAAHWLKLSPDTTLLDLLRVSGDSLGRRNNGSGRHDNLELP